MTPSFVSSPVSLAVRAGLLSLAASLQPAFAQSVTLPEVIVTAEREVSPFASNKTTSLGYQLPAQQTPATVNTVTQEFWDATGSRTLDEVLSYIPGISLGDNGGWTGDTLVIRGFPSTLPYRDGMRAVDSGYKQSLRAMSDNIERIEVVKGPAGAEFGVVEPGGAVNFITKKPQKETLRSMNAGLGEDGYRKIGGDFTGALNEGRDVQGRLVFAYAEPAEWRDGRPDNTYQYVFAPSVNLDYDKGNVLLAYERNYQKSPQDRGIIYLEGVGWENNFAPRDWSFHQTSSNQVNETDRLTLSNKHGFNEALTLRTTLEHQRYKYRLAEFRNAMSEPGWGPLYGPDNHSWSGVSVIPLLWDEWAGDTSSNSFKTVLDYSFDAGGTKHTVSGGFDYYRNKTNSSYGGFDISNTFDIFNPVNDQTPNILQEYPAFTDTIKVREEGGSLRWLGHWNERFRTILGVRHSDYSYDYSDMTGSSSGYGSDKYSWRVAGSYDLNRDHTVFAGFSDGYIPQSGLMRGDLPVKPIHDKSTELGVKSAFMDRRVLWTNSIYEIKRDDLTLDDPTNDPTTVPPEAFLINGGSARIRGFESELMGQVTPNLQIRGGFAYMDSEITANDTAAFVGNRFANTPEQQYSLLLSYGWGSFDLPALRTDIGVVHVGDRYGNSGNTITLPSYTLLNLGASYQLDRQTTLRLAIVNATDETYYTGMQDSGAQADQVMVGNKRNAFVTLTHNF